MLVGPRSVDYRRTTSGADRRQAVVRQRGRVRQRLADVLIFEVGTLGDDFGRSHPIRQKVDDVTDRDAQTTNGGAPRKNTGIVTDSIKGVRHTAPNSS